MRTRRTLSKKATLAKVLNATGLISALGSRRLERQLLVFAFHRVASDVGYVSRFDHTMYSTYASEFEAHLKKLLKIASPISEDQLIASINSNGNIQLPKRAFMITFDDGYKDNYEIAMPILKKLGIPGVFFLPTKAIEDRTLGWWDLIYWCLKSTNKKSITVRGQVYNLLSDVTAVAESFTSMIKNRPFQETQTLVSEIQDACEVDLPTLEDQSAELMTWDNAKSCLDNGISIGSHTNTHRVLSQLTVAEQKEELITSKKILEEKLGSKINSIAYPVGGYEHFTQSTKSLAESAGYKVAYSFLTGINHASKVDSFDVKRIDHYLDEYSYEGAFALPTLFAGRTCKANSPVPQL